MSVFGYIFLTVEKEHLVDEEAQRKALYSYVQSFGGQLEELFVEEGTALKRPLKERREGGRMLDRCMTGDLVVTMNSAWILGSAVEGGKLLAMLRDKNVALYCLDIGENISIKDKRKLVVYEGCAPVVAKLLAALSLCESSGHGEAIRASKRNLKKQGKYIGGPVPFGWQVNQDKVLEENEEQQKIIQAIIAMREDRWSYRDISDKLKVEYEVQLSHAGIRRILNNDRKKKEALAAKKDAG